MLLQQPVQGLVREALLLGRRYACRELSDQVVTKRIERGVGTADADAITQRLAAGGACTKCLARCIGNIHRTGPALAGGFHAWVVAQSRQIDTDAAQRLQHAQAGGELVRHIVDHGPDFHAVHRRAFRSSRATAGA